MAKDIWSVFSGECPGVAEAYLELFREINVDGALDQKTMCLVLVGIQATTRDPLSLRYWVRQAFKAGASKREVEAAALLSWSVGVSSAELSIPIILDVEEESGQQ